MKFSLLCFAGVSAADVVAAKANAQVQMLARQLIMAQSNTEQRVRSEGGSGLTQVRSYHGGSRPFHSATDVNSLGAAASHNHVDFYKVVGMAEFGAVLNGVEFWTRHNDYSLRTPSKTSNKYHATEYIDYPDVPPAVLAKATVGEQIIEMREWFKAWQNSDHTVRDYRPYFKPVMSYLEGAWIKDAGAIKEPFQSDRHHIDATTWKQLHDKTRFLLANGRKNNLENLPYLPTAVRDMVGPKNDIPETANFEYRISCVELKKDIPLYNLRTDKNLMNQLYTYPNSKTQEQLKRTRQARFEVNQRDTKKWFEGVSSRSLLDEMMEQVPGKNNFMANLNDYTGGEQSMSIVNSSQKLNVGYYSRYYTVQKADASGRSNRKRGFNDPTLWAAKTTQPKVSGLNYKDGYGITKCSLADACVSNVVGEFQTALKARADLKQDYADLTDDQIWQKTIFTHTNRALFNDKCVAAKTCACPQVAQPVAKTTAEWTLDKTYHTDAQLLCRDKINEQFWVKTKDVSTPTKNTHLNSGKLVVPIVANPTCGVLHPTDFLSTSWKKCPREATHEKWTWAVPLELIYMTPLHNWNPYKLEPVSEAIQTGGGKGGASGTRTGSLTDKEKAWIGYSRRHRYLTPSAFFSGSADKDVADTAKTGVGVIAHDGTIQAVAPSGTWVTLPTIAGVTGLHGQVRTRFPIYPLHVAGNNIWKELKALEAVQLTGDQKMTQAVREEALGMTFELSFANGHVHTIKVAGADLVTKLAKEGQQHTVSSTLNNGHEHQVTLKRVKDGKFEMVSMDPPEPHRLVAITGAAGVKDSEIKKNGQLNQAPVPSPVAEPVAGQSQDTKKQFAKLTLALGKIQAELTALKAANANKAGSCQALGEVKTLLTDLQAA